MGWSMSWCRCVGMELLILQVFMSTGGPPKIDEVLLSSGATVDPVPNGVMNVAPVTTPVASNADPDRTVGVGSVEGAGIGALWVRDSEP